MTVVSRALRNPIGWALLLVLAVLVCASIFSVVPETSQALVVRMGQPVRVVNRYRADEPFGGEGAGLLAHVPLLEQVVFVDKRVRDAEVARQPLVTADGQRVEVAAFARYRVVDPLRLFAATRGDDKRVDEALQPVLGAALRDAFGRLPLAALFTPHRDRALVGVRAALDQAAARYGARVADVRVRRVGLPDGAPLDAALDRMRSAQVRQAAVIRADGARDAGEIRAQADADAARTYADAFNQDPDFYDFYRSMQSYRATFGVDAATEGGTTFVIGPQSEYLRNFTGRAK